MDTTSTLPEPPFDGGDFSGSNYSGGRVSFRRSQFSGAEVSFGDSTFSGGEVFFNGSEFSGGQVDFERLRVQAAATIRWGPFPAFPVNQP
ncbi:hypothetical protein [Streptomyces microflavus]|uniref:hypothetical protein n=1 Tax=Streptomyces microflavus TaxID=1919 RepID=UPI00340308BB